MAARSQSRQGMVRGLAVRASTAWARARGAAPSPCLLEAGISAAPSPDRLSLCASIHSLPPCTPHFSPRARWTIPLCCSSSAWAPHGASRLGRNILHSDTPEVVATPHVAAMSCCLAWQLSQNDATLACTSSFQHWRWSCMMAAVLVHKAFSTSVYYCIMTGPKASHVGVWALPPLSLCLPQHSTIVAFSGIAHLVTRLMPVEGRCDSSPSAPGGPFGALGLPSAFLRPEGILRLVGAICLFIRSCLPIRTCPVRVILIHITCASPEPLQVSLLLPTAALCICPQQGIPKTTKTVTAHLHVSRHGQQGCLPLQAGDCMCY